LRGPIDQRNRPEWAGRPVEGKSGFVQTALLLENLYDLIGLGMVCFGSVSPDVFAIAEKIDDPHQVIVSRHVAIDPVKDERLRIG
jgi:hypothetical protein